MWLNIQSTSVGGWSSWEWLRRFLSICYLLTLSVAEEFSQINGCMTSVVFHLEDGILYKLDDSADTHDTAQDSSTMGWGLTKLCACVFVGKYTRETVFCTSGTHTLYINVIRTHIYYVNPGTH